MESHSHRRISRRAMASEEDRLSSLPDDLLHSILRGVPLKQAARTSVLSRHWAPQWLRAFTASPVLHLTNQDFARSQPPVRAAATVGRCLRLHTEHGGPLHAFCVALVSPSPLGLGDGGSLGRDVAGWVTAAVRRGATEVEVRLTPPSQDEDADAAMHDDDRGSATLLESPGDLFDARNSLQRLALGRVSLRAVALPAARLAGLRSLSFSHADVTDDTVRGVLASCPALEYLSLRSCHLLTSVRVASERLRRVLELVGCQGVRELRVAAPALESFVLCAQSHASCNDSCGADDGRYGGRGGAFDLGATPAPRLRDACLSHLGCDLNVARDMGYPYYLYRVVARTRILTICSIGLLVP